MVKTEEFEILGADEKLFCKCVHDADGSIRLVSKNTSMTLQELQQKAMNPAMSRKSRGKKQKRKIS